MDSQVGTPVERKSISLVGTPVGSQNSIKDGCSSTSIPQFSIPENQKCWTCSNEFGSETIAWTHADPLPPPEPSPKCLTPHDLLCVLHSNCSEKIDNQTPLDIETRPLGVHRGSNLSLSREFLSDNVMHAIFEKSTFSEILLLMTGSILVIQARWFIFIVMLMNYSQVTVHLLSTVER